VLAAAGAAGVDGARDVVVALAVGATRGRRDVHGVDAIDGDVDGGSGIGGGAADE
jgi:hypothetical protein